MLGSQLRTGQSFQQGPGITEVHIVCVCSAQDLRDPFKNSWHGCVNLTLLTSRKFRDTITLISAKYSDSTLLTYYIH